MPKVKLTKRSVEAAKPVPGKRITLRDTDIKGFQCRIAPSGTKTYFLYYRNDAGTERRPKIGVHGKEVTAVKAREIAEEWRGLVAQRQDPSQDRKHKRKQITFKEFGQIYLDDYAKKEKKASSAAEDERNLKNHVYPAFGSLKITQIEYPHIAELYEKMRSTPAAANRVYALLSKMFNFSEEPRPKKEPSFRDKGTNPCRLSTKKRVKEKPRERYLASGELSNLSKTLKKCEHEAIESQSVIDAIRLLIFTGCRRSEILTLKWAYIDFDNKVINLPDSKAGAKTVHLAAPALEILNKIKRLKNNPYVITGKNEGSHLVNIQKAWSRIRTKAKLSDVRLHDLRHTFASYAIGAGQALPMIGALLGHKQMKTTERYAHLADDPLKKSVETVGAVLEAAMNTGDTHINIIELKK